LTHTVDATRTDFQLHVLLHPHSLQAAFI